MTGSSTDAEYVALCTNIFDSLSLRSSLQKIRFWKNENFTIHEDNLGAIALLKNIKTKCNKYIDIKFHIIKQSSPVRRSCVVTH